jgi:hypothetical protein
VRSSKAGRAMRQRYNVGLAATILLLAVIVSGVFASGEEKVYFNVETKKYHCLTCRWAIACTRNCIKVPLSDAKRRGGVACKVCGGRC